MLTTDLQEFRFCFSWLMNRRLALMGPCREHIARASLASPAPSNWAGGMAPQGKVSSELGCVPAVGPCRDPPPLLRGQEPWDVPQDVTGCWKPSSGGWQPPLPPADSGCSLPWEGIAGICRGVQLSRALLGSVPLGTVPSFSAPLPLAPPLLLSPTAPIPCVPPRVCPALGGGSPLLPPPQFGQAGPQHPQASCCSWGVLSAQRPFLVKELFFFFFFSRTNNHSSKITAHLFKVRHSVFSGKCVLRTS